MHIVYLGCPFSACQITCRWVYEKISGRAVVAGSSGGHALDVFYVEVLGSRAKRWVQSGPVQPAAGRGRSEVVCVCTLLMFTLQQARHRSDHTVDRQVAGASEQYDPSMGEQRAAGSSRDGDKRTGAVNCLGEEGKRQES